MLSYLGQKTGLARTAFTFLFASLFLSACSTFLTGPNISTSQTGDNPAQAVPAGTEPDDVVIGRREHPKIVEAYGGVYTHRRAENMLSQIVTRLLVAAGQSPTSFKITILDSEEVNAFALPGGYIYVTRGILALANDTSELAAVLAHEISHVTLRHARARTNRVATSELVDKVITGVLGGDAQTDQGVARSKLSLAAFSQGQELAADEEGVKIAAQAGYDPSAAARFLGTMSRFSGSNSGAENQGDNFLSSHPSTPDRIRRAAEAARSFENSGPVDVDRAGYLAAIEGITFGANTNQGAIVGQQFIHPGLRFTFSLPARFELQNTPEAVVGVAGDGEAVRFDSAEVPASMKLTDYLKSGWIAGLDANSVREERHNGVDMATGSAQTDQWAFRVIALRFRGGVYRFIFAAHRDNGAFSKAAQDTIASFRTVTSRDLARISEMQITLVTARSGDSAESLAARMGAAQGGRAMFLLLNNLFAGDEVVVGQSYKIIAAR